MKEQTVLSIRANRDTVGSKILKKKHASTIAFPFLNSIKKQTLLSIQATRETFGTEFPKKEDAS